MKSIFGLLGNFIKHSFWTDVSISSKKQSNAKPGHAFSIVLCKFQPIKTIFVYYLQPKKWREVLIKGYLMTKMGLDAGKQ